MYICRTQVFGCSLSIYVCMYHLSIHLSISINHSVNQSICQSIYVSTIYLSIYPSIYLRSRSVDSLRGGRVERSLSRSVSPTHSSSMESHSIKDSPIQLGRAGGCFQNAKPLFDQPFFSFFVRPSVSYFVHPSPFSHTVKLLTCVMAYLGLCVYCMPACLGLTECEKGERGREFLQYIQKNIQKVSEVAGIKIFEGQVTAATFTPFLKMNLKHFLWPSG